MTNPLKSVALNSSGSFAGMAVGETRTVTFCGKPTRDMGFESLSRTITRTNRPFIQDWIDAANAEMPAGSHERWVLDGAGTPQLRNMKFFRA